jgi:general secretion pathway protein D
MVGENIPFVTGQSQTAATGGQIVSQIDRKDVGITLKLTPQISSDDNVRLDIYQEISAVTETAGLNPNIVGPSTSKRSASTTVVVKDKETVVIGGLIRDNVTSSTMKVPLLGDIPILGWFFKYKTTKVEKVNLMIFITPYIIKSELDAQEITRKKGDAIEEFRKEHHIEKKDMGGLIESKKPGSAPTVTAPTGTTQSPVKPAEETGATEKTGITAPVQSAPTGTTQITPAEGVR